MIELSSLRKLSLTCLAIFLLALSACFGNSFKLEQEASNATLEWMDQEYGVVEDDDADVLFTKLSQRLGGTVSRSALEDSFPRWKTKRFKKYPWKIYLVDNDVPNAFSAGAGKIFVTSGLLTSLTNEAELAAVISHEFAHQLLGHPKVAIKSMKRQQDKGNTPKFFYSLKQELQADRLGLNIMKVAGYDVRHSLSALSLGYRRESGHSNIRKPDLDRRLAELFVEVYDRKRFLPSRYYSRDFTRLQQKLSFGMGR